MKLLFFPILSGLFLILSAELNAQIYSGKYTASISGKIISADQSLPGVRFSENSKYKCTFAIDEVTDENRKLSDLQFYKEGELVYTLTDIQGADVEISNSGILAVFDHSVHYSNQVTISFYDGNGNPILTETFYGVNAFIFSDSGNAFAVRNRTKIITYSFSTNRRSEYAKGLNFGFDESDEYFVVANEDEIRVYNKEVQINSITTNTSYPRKIVVSTVHNLLAIIDRINLIVYNLSDGEIIFSEQTNGSNYFRDLIIRDGILLAGVQTRNEKLTKGSLVAYLPDGTKIGVVEGQMRELNKYKSEISLPENRNQYESIPWPFYPFDSTHTVWNHYEQHMGGGSDYSYLHQGLDIITPIAEPTFAVKGGIVKCVLTLGGAVYWRLAISDSNIEDYSNGWLYAHLIESTIAFDVGDTVEQFDYLGDIVAWTNDWGHIHFVEIRDSGFVWLYNDNEWGINFNPLLALVPVNDDLPPEIENVFTDSKFGFCENETSNYLNADSLTGEVDIIVKVVDYIGNSEWQQPAFKILYWIKELSTGVLITDTTLSHILNHSYGMYNSSSFEPYATVLYKRDQIFPSPSWMDPVRNYYHIITNSDGDSVINIAEKFLALNTAQYSDGIYRIYVKAFDPNGNFDLDSMDVVFKNGFTSVNPGDEGKLFKFTLEQNFPNPFNPSTIISYQLPAGNMSSLKVYDTLGNEVKELVNEYKTAGTYNAEFYGSELSSGVYFYELISGSYREIKKMVLIK